MILANRRAGSFGTSLPYPGELLVGREKMRTHHSFDQNSLTLCFMANGDAKHAFISYVKEDKEEVDRLCRILDRSGVPYWRDRKDLAPGDAWKAKIREAIRSGSLIFLACFSENSRARDKSYMNEELSLAVDEFRQRAPGATWLIPVRFDDGDVPDWDLGAGRTLSDLNYSDLFGEEYAAEAASLVTTVAATMAVSPADSVQTVASVETAGPAERRLLMRRATKEMLLDSSRRIALDDLVRQETRRVVLGLQDQTAMPLSRPAEAETEGPQYIWNRVHALTELVSPLCWSLQVAGRWADRETFAIWTEAVRSIASTALEPTSGVTNLLSLRALPALCLLSTGALAAHSSGRWDNLRELALLPILTRRGESEPLCLAISPWTPFNSDEFLPNLLARSAEDGSDVEAVAESISKGRIPRLLTPVSDWLLAFARPVFDEQFALTSDMERAFDNSETFLGILSQDALNQTSDTWRNAAWFGRDTWQDRYRRGDVVDDVEAEIKAAGTNWPPLDGGLFNGSPDRARKATTAYGETFRRIAHDRFR